jgi:carbamoyl-phosphate synthase large subunit
MPRRQDLNSILILGSGPIVIGQACEFDYSGVQACKALRADGYRIVLINSNPATIMTDPEMADRTYIEPITPEVVAKIIEQERPDAILPTLGGQTALNCAMQLHDMGVLQKFDVEMIGAGRASIQKAEGRLEFKRGDGEDRADQCARRGSPTRWTEARKALDEIGLPCVIRPGFTMGGSGGGIAYNLQEFEDICGRGLQLSLNSEVLVEESIAGWKEYELEVVRDKNDNVIIVCSIENFDPMGVHTGDSITVAPAQTLSDREYQLMRDAAIACIREIGVDTGGSNVQFAIDPKDGRMIVIEMNPRVSRSRRWRARRPASRSRRSPRSSPSATRSTRLDNDITKVDEGLLRADDRLLRREVPALGVREVPDRGLGADHADEVGRRGDGDRRHLQGGDAEGAARARDGPQRLRQRARQAALQAARTATPKRSAPTSRRRAPTASTGSAARCSAGMSVEEIHDYSRIDPWFLDQLPVLSATSRRSSPRPRTASRG